MSSPNQSSHAPYAQPNRNDELFSPGSEYTSPDRSQPDVATTELNVLVRPMEWPASIKFVVLFQVCAHAGLSSWCAAAFIPAFLQMSRALDRSIDQMTYLVGGYTLMMGFGVIVWNSLADRFGRRPVMLFSLAIAVASSCGAARASIYATMMLARLFQGFAICACNSLGAVYIKDMYQPRHRGKALGIWTLGLTAGPFVGPFVSGFIATRASYTWIIWLEALLLSTLFIFELVFLPESVLYAPCYQNVLGLRDIILQLPRSSPTRKTERDISIEPMVSESHPVTSHSFRQTLQAMKYPAVWMCGLGFAVPYGYIAVGVSSLFPTVYGTLYGFSPSEQGLLYVPMFIGSILAELITGRVGDWAVAEPHRGRLATWVAYRNVGSNEPTERVLEMRLIVGLFGTLLSIAGLLWFGLGVDRHLYWANPAVASGLAAFGVQMLTSICFSYVIDCYPKSAKEVATVMNIFRVLSSFVVLFYNARLDTAVGYASSFGIQSVITAVFGFGGLGWLVMCGGRWRNTHIASNS